MEYLGVIIVVLIGSALVLIRDFYAKFILSFLYRIPAVKHREIAILRWISVITALLGVAFIVVGVLLATGVENRS